MTRSPRRLIAVGMVLAFGALLGSHVSAGAAPAASAAKYDLGGGKGHVEYRSYGLVDGRLTTSLTYLPARWSKAQRLPVYVMVHGCGTTAAQQMGANLLNPIADRERFIVVYPDNGGDCFRAVSDDILAEPATGEAPHSTRGGKGDADAIATMARQTVVRYNADRDRVYMIGMSAGAFQASHTAVAYPDVFAAVGVAAGGGPGQAVTCLGHTQASVLVYARLAMQKMGSRARVMPFFTIGGTKDQLGEDPVVGGCARQAFFEWLYIDNSLKPRDTSAPVPGVSSQLPPEAAAAVGRRDTFEVDPRATRAGQVRDGYSWTAYSARDSSGCTIGQRWVVDGLGHAWSGGSTDPKYTAVQPSGGPGFNDPKGPSASQVSWDFFKQFSLRSGNVRCRR